MQRVAVMDDMQVPGGLSSAIAGALAVVTWAGFKLRALMSKDKVSRQGDDAVFDVVKMQREQIDRQNTYITELIGSLNESNETARQMRQALDEANSRAKGMQSEMHRMAARIDSLEEMVRSLGGTP